MGATVAPLTRGPYMPRDEDYTRKRLERFLPIMRECAVKAVRESMDDYVKTAPKHRKTTTRSITRDHLVTTCVAS